MHLRIRGVVLTKNAWSSEHRTDIFTGQKPNTLVDQISTTPNASACAAKDRISWRKINSSTGVTIALPHKCVRGLKRLAQIEEVYVFGNKSIDFYTLSHMNEIKSPMSPTAPLFLAPQPQQERLQLGANCAESNPVCPCPEIVSTVNIGACTLRRIRSPCELGDVGYLNLLPTD